MKDTIKVIETPAGATWSQVATQAATILAQNLKHLHGDTFCQIHMVLPSGDGVIVSTLTDSMYTVMPGKGWEHFDKYGLHQRGDGVMFSQDMLAPARDDSPAMVQPEVIHRMRLAFMRAAR